MRCSNHFVSAAQWRDDWVVHGKNGDNVPTLILIFYKIKVKQIEKMCDFTKGLGCETENNNFDEVNQREEESVP